MFEDPADEPEDKDHQTKHTITSSAGYPIDTKSSGDDRALGETHTSAASAAVARLEPKGPNMTLRSAKGRTTEVGDVPQIPDQLSHALPTLGSAFSEALSPGSATGPMAGQATEASRRMVKEAT